MRYSANMEGVEEGTGNIFLSEGIHNVRIVKCIDKITQNNDPMISVMFIGLDSEHFGHTVWDNIIIPKIDSPAIKILGRTKHFLHVIGENYDGIIEGDSDNWINKECKVKVFHETWENKEGIKKTNAKVSEYMLEVESVDLGNPPEEGPEL